MDEGSLYSENERAINSRYNVVDHQISSCVLLRNSLFARGVRVKCNRNSNPGPLEPLVRSRCEKADL